MVILLLALFSGKLLYAASMPMEMAMVSSTSLQHDHCHDSTDDCDQQHHGMQHDSDAQCLLDCLDSCSISALLELYTPDLSYHKASIEFEFITPTISRRLEPLYRPPQA